MPIQMGTASAPITHRVRLLWCLALTLLAATPAVAQAAPPPNDAFANAQVVTLPTQLMGTSVEATTEMGEPVPIVDSVSVWYRLTTPMGQRVRIDTCGSGSEAWVNVYTGSDVDGLTYVTGTEGTCLGGGRAYLTTTPGTTYHISVSGVGSNVGAFKLTVATPVPPPNDAFANATLLAVPGQQVGTNVDATTEPGEPDELGIADYSVWYRLSVPETAAIGLHTCATPLDTVMAVYTGSSVGSLTPVDFNDQGCGGGNGSLVNFTALAGTTYRISVRGYHHEAGNFTITAGPPIAPPPPPPPPPPAPAPPPPPPPTIPCPLAGSPENAAGYKGEHQSGEVCLTVAPDFSGITSFQVIGARGEGCFFPLTVTRFDPPLPVVNKTFSTTQDSFTGAFGEARTVSGAIQLVRSVFGETCTSNLIAWSAETPATPPWMIPKVPPPPPPPVDRTPPVLRLSGPTVQRPQTAYAILVSALCPNEVCKVRASMTVKKTTLKVPSRFLQRGVKTTLKLVLTKKARRGIRRAMGKRRSLKTKIVVVASDSMGNAVTERRTITLKR